MFMIQQRYCAFHRGCLSLVVHPCRRFGLLLCNSCTGHLSGYRNWLKAQGVVMFAQQPASRLSMAGSLCTRRNIFSQCHGFMRYFCQSVISRQLCKYPRSPAIFQPAIGCFPIGKQIYWAMLQFVTDPARPNSAVLLRVLYLYRTDPEALLMCHWPAALPDSLMETLSVSRIALLVPSCIDLQPPLPAPMDSDSVII